MALKRIITIIAFCICLFLAVYYVFGFVLKNKIEFLISEFFPDGNSTYEFLSYKQGIFSSKAVLKFGTSEANEFGLHQVLDYLGAYPEQIEIQVVLDIQHGPIPIASVTEDRSSLFAFGVINFRLDNETMTGKRISDFIPFEVDPLVSATIHLDGSGTITSTLASNSVVKEVKDNEVQGKWADIEAKINFNSDVSKIDNVTKVESLHIKLNRDFILEAQNSLIKVDFNNPPAGKKEFEVRMGADYVQIDAGRSGKSTISFNDIKLKGTATVSDNIANAAFKFQIDQPTFLDHKFKKFACGSTISGLSIDAINLLVQQNAVSGLTFSFDNKPPQALLDAAKKILAPGLVVSVDPFSLMSETKQYGGSLHARIADALPDGNFLSAESLKSIDGELSLSLPQNVILNIVRQRVESEATQKAGFIGEMAADAGIIDKLITAKIRALEGKGILEKEGDNYRIKLELNEGELSVNGLDFSITELL